MPVIKKIIEARKNLAIPAKITSKKLNYAYFSSSSIISAVKKAFDEQNILIFPSDVEIAEESSITTSGGSVVRQVTLKITYIIVDNESDDKMEVKILGRSQDLLEKNINKAMAQGLKTLLMQLLLIGEDNEQENNGEVSSKMIEDMIQNSKNNDKPGLVKLINDLDDNKEKSRLMKMLKDRLK